MYPFLILSSLSVGFYLVLLVALQRDSRRYRRTVVGTLPNRSFNTRTIHVLSSTFRVPSDGLNANVSKVAVPTFFGPNPIASSTTLSQPRRPAYSAGLNQVRGSGDARPSLRESFHA